MNDAGAISIVNKLLACKTKGQAEAELTTVGKDYLNFAQRLLRRMSFPRTNNQNALYYKHIAEIARQTHDTELSVRRYVKYTFGLPILFRRMPEQAERCRNYLGHIPQEEKLALMDLFQVSSLMTTAEMKAYMKQIEMHYLPQGVVLTQPEEKAA